MMIIHLVRHAEKENGDFYSQALRRNDNPISKKGMAQADLLSEYLPDRVGHIYVSDLRRTTQTIQPYANLRQIPSTMDGRINEIDTGALARLPEKYISEKYPEFWKEYTEKDSDFYYPEGENGKDVSLRIRSLIKQIFSANSEIIIVGHDGWIRIFLCMVMNLEFYERFRFRIANCGISTIRLNSDSISGSVIRINDCSYLKEMITYDA